MPGLDTEHDQYVVKDHGQVGSLYGPSQFALILNSIEE